MGGVNYIALWTKPGASGVPSNEARELGEAIGAAIGVGLIVLVPVAVVAVIVFFVTLPGARRRRAQEDAQRRAAHIEDQRKQAAAEAWRRAANDEAQRQWAFAEEQRREAEAASRAAALAAAEKARNDDLVSRFGPAAAARVLRREIWQVMSAAMLTESRGSPSDVDEKVLKSKTKHVFKYSQSGVNRYGLRIMLEDGVVVGWDDKR